MDMILKIYELIPKQESDFQTKTSIDRVCKVLDGNDIDTSYKSLLKSLVVRGQCSGPMRDNKLTFLNLLKDFIL